MRSLPNALQNKLSKRQATGELRSLASLAPDSIDFFSNDYLSFARDGATSQHILEYLNTFQSVYHGSTGSRLISGNHPIFVETERKIADFHQFEEALLFNSGYDANLGLLSSIGQRGDVFFYDEFCHASMRDGMRLSDAAAYKFPHQDMERLEQLLQKNRHKFQTIYIVTESVFSMDGDVSDIKKLAEITEKYQALLIVDEAHALGVVGEKGEGLVSSLGLQNKVWANVVTYGKALGCHGAAVLGSSALKAYLINFSRAFIYTTALPPIAVATIHKHYDLLINQPERIFKLRNIINAFCALPLTEMVERSENSSAIQYIKAPDVETLKRWATYLQNERFAVKPIYAPTVPKGAERIRICLHAHNTEEEIIKLGQALKASF